MSTFFKVVLQQSLRDRKLMLPPKFVRKFRRNLPEFAFFELPNGGIWKMSLEKTNRVVWLREGWAEFANHNSLENGNFLLCTYDGNYKFHVQIFGLDGMEIDYHANPNQELHLISSEEESDESYEASNDQSLDDYFLTYQNKSKSAENKKKRKNKMRRETSETRAISAPKRNFKSSTKGHGQAVSNLLDKVEAIRKKEASKYKKSLLVVGIQPSYIRGKYMYVPVSFIQEHLGQGFIDIDLHTSDGRSWPVVLKPKPRPRICVGWPKFQKDNNLKAGDVIVFELVNRNPFAFKVRIY